jgi:hypothetical protein
LFGLRVCIVHVQGQSGRPQPDCRSRRRCVRSGGEARRYFPSNCPCDSPIGKFGREKGTREIGTEGRHREIIAHRNNPREALLRDEASSGGGELRREGEDVNRKRELSVVDIRVRLCLNRRWRPHTAVKSCHRL